MNRAICLITALSFGSNNNSWIFSLYNYAHHHSEHIFYRFYAPCFLWQTSEWVRWQDGVWKISVLLFYALIWEHCECIFLLLFQMIHKIAFYNFTRKLNVSIDARWRQKNLFIIYVNHGEENSCFLSHLSNLSHACELRRAGRKLWISLSDKDCVFYYN